VQVFLPEMSGFAVQKSLWSITIGDKPIQSLSLEPGVVDASGTETNLLPILSVLLDFSNLSAYSPEYCQLYVFLYKVSKVNRFNSFSFPCIHHQVCPLHASFLQCFKQGISENLLLPDTVPQRIIHLLFELEDMSTLK